MHMVVKERRTKILLSLFLFSDVNLSSVNFNQNLQKVFDVNLNQKTRGSLSGLLREGMIEKTGENQYKLTQKGFGALTLSFPFFRFLREEWDGKWRILSYEIPEKKRDLRDRLRREVAGWGLGPWHRSFWLTPHPIIENLRLLVSQKEEEKYIQAFEGDHVFGEQKILIEKVWQTQDIDKKYRELFKKWHDILSSEGDKTDKLTKVVNLYVEQLRLDPGLPKNLIGETWIGFEAYNIFKEIRSILLS